MLLPAAASGVLLVAGAAGCLRTAAPSCAFAALLLSTEAYVGLRRPAAAAAAAWLMPKRPCNPLQQE